MSHLKPSTTTLRKSALMFMVVGLSVLSAATLAGQGPFAPASGPLDLILQELDALQAAVASLAPPDPEPSEVALRTSPVPIQTGINTFVDCNLANVSERTILVAIRLLRADGTDTVSNFTTEVAPGRSVLVGSNATTGLRRCEFRFAGFADEVRANMTVSDNQITNPITPRLRGLRGAIRQPWAGTGLGVDHVPASPSTTSREVLA